MYLRRLVFACFNEMMESASSRHFAILDVCDRMMLNYDTVERILEEGLQLELFPEEV